MNLHHHHDDDELWKYPEDDEIEVYVNGEEQDGGGNAHAQNRIGDHLANGKKTSNGVKETDHFRHHHGNRRRHKDGVTLERKLKDGIHRIKIYERKRMEGLDGVDDDYYENQTTVVTTYELPSSSSPPPHHHYQQSSEEDEEDEEMSKEDYETQESRDCENRRSSSSPSSTRGTRSPRIMIRRDSDLDLLVNKVNVFDPFQCCLRCPQKLDHSCTCWYPMRTKLNRWIEWTGVDRRLYGLPRWFKMFLVVSLCLLGVLVYATIVTVGVKAILAQ